MQAKAAKKNPYIFQPFGKENDEGFDNLDDEYMRVTKVASEPFSSSINQTTTTDNHLISRAELFAAAPTVRYGSFVFHLDMIHDIQ
jgi:hypothetical protein